MQQGATGNTISPLKQTNPGINIFNTADDGLFYASRNNGYVDSLDPAKLKTAPNFLPAAVDRFNQYRVEGSSSDLTLTKATDMIVSQNQIFHLSSGQVTVLPVQKIKQYQSNSVGSVTQLQQSAAISQNYMLQDGESWDTLTNRNLRYFKVAGILSASVEKNNIMVQSFSAAPISDLDI